MCMPPICAEIGLSLVTIMEFTTNQSRNPFGNGTYSPADIVGTARNDIKNPAKPRIPMSLRSMSAPPGLRLRKAKITLGRFSVNLRGCGSNVEECLGKLLLLPPKHLRRDHRAD